jgi:hypothetical protein
VRGRYRRGLAASYAAGASPAASPASGCSTPSGCSTTLQAGAVPLVLGAAVLAGRTVWGWLSGTKERNLRRLADRLSDFAEENVAENASPRPMLTSGDERDRG